jgi:2-aminophenol/2-amino-5-chlorophenol 1,6-dioxygenase subunit alpha
MAWVPGLPHLLAKEKSAQWLKVSEAMENLKERIDRAKPDVLVVFSTQWLSVLGTSFQAHPNPNGVHVDENWHELGDLPFNFVSDSELARSAAEEVSRLGLPARTVNFDDFPIDTGTIVGLTYLNCGAKPVPVLVCSAWVYADRTKARQIGEAVGKAIESSGKRAFVLASSLLSARYFTDEIALSEDRISAVADDEWNRQCLGAMEAGQWNIVEKMQSTTPPGFVFDMQFSAFHWLRGVMGGESYRGRVLHYGPIWGTGAAVVELVSVPQDSPQDSK